jgi:hypothetical protein
MLGSELVAAVWLIVSQGRGLVVFSLALAQVGGCNSRKNPFLKVVDTKFPQYLLLFLVKVKYV